MKNKIKNYIEERYPDYMDKILLADGFDEAFIGIVESFGSEPKACYGRETCIEILAKSMDYEDAQEYFSYNVEQAYVGEYTPAFINVMELN